MKGIILFLILFMTNISAETLECRIYTNMKVGIYIDVYDDKIIDSNKNIFEKISSSDGLNIFRGFDKKYNKYFVWIIKNESNNTYEDISSFDALLMEDVEKASKTKLICFYAKEVNRYRQKTAK